MSEKPSMTIITEGGRMQLRPNATFVQFAQDFRSRAYREIAGALGINCGDDPDINKQLIIAELQLHGVTGHRPPALPDAELLLLELGGWKLESEGGMSKDPWPQTEQELSVAIADRIRRRS